jgi:diguanylate cyclase (GGDEF)-like protein
LKIGIAENHYHRLRGLLMPEVGMLDTQRIAIDRFWQFARQGMLIAIGLHVVFGIAGFLVGAWPLLAVQIVTIAIYSLSYVLSSRGHRWLPITLTWLDLLGHATLCCLIVGVGSGFQYYSWILLPLLFANVHRKLKVKIALAIGLTALYVLIDWWLHRTTPWVAVSPTAIAGLRYFNIACFLIALGMIASAHSRTVDDAERRLSALASTDALTGLLNRRRMSDLMQKELAQACIVNRPLAVMLLDIDHFKIINDQYGHARGDQVILAVGEILRANVRQLDLVARWGGEEFLVLMPDAGLDAARETAERVRRAVASYVVRDETDAVPVTITAGVSAWNETERLEDTIHRADTVLYLGKQAGRDRVVVDATSYSNGNDPILRRTG